MGVPVKIPHQIGEVTNCPIPPYSSAILTRMKRLLPVLFCFLFPVAMLQGCASYGCGQQGERPCRSSDYYIPGKGVWADRKESPGEKFMRESIFPKSKTFTPSNYDPDERKLEHALWFLKQGHTKKAAIQGIKSLATKGNPRAQFVMCEVYAKGVGVTQSWTTAKKWCDRFVAQGYQDKDRLPEKVNVEVEKLKKAEIKRENLSSPQVLGHS